MQIGNNVYLEVKVKGSDREGIVSFDMLRKFKLVETAGASLPYICLSFVTTDESLANLFLQNNEITVYIGDTKENANTFSFHPIAGTKLPGASNKYWDVYCAGFIGKNEFMVNQGICGDYPGNSTETEFLQIAGL